jgi:hypothetical protein
MIVCDDARITQRVPTPIVKNIEDKE